CEQQEEGLISRPQASPGSAKPAEHGAYLIPVRRRAGDGIDTWEYMDETSGARMAPNWPSEFAPGGTPKLVPASAGMPAHCLGGPSCILSTAETVTTQGKISTDS